MDKYVLIAEIIILLYSKHRYRKTESCTGATNEQGRDLNADSQNILVSLPEMR